MVLVLLMTPSICSLTNVYVTFLLPRHKAKAKKIIDMKRNRIKAPLKKITLLLLLLLLLLLQQNIRDEKIKLIYILFHDI